MSRQQAIAQTLACFDDGRFQQVLARRVAMRTESQNEDGGPALRAYLDHEIAPHLGRLGFACRVVENPVMPRCPLLLAERLEPGAPFTLLTYGHGDVVRGYDAQWRAGLSPWEIVVEGNRWYGRGTADNKGQHTINLMALEQVLAVREDRLGYNIKLVLEMGEEAGSPGLNEVCAQHRESLAADLFLASDGPRVAASRATLFLGSRGVFNFDLRLKLREGGHHSGNWGGLLRNPGIRLAHAIASLIDAHGRILVPGLLPAELPPSVRVALQDIEVGGGPGDPAIDPGWGEPGTVARRARDRLEQPGSAGFHHRQPVDAGARHPRRRTCALPHALCRRQRRGELSGVHTRAPRPARFRRRRAARYRRAHAGDPARSG